jgi:hypothetical protein
VKVNVHIKVYEQGRLIEERVGHNNWVNRGRAWLANVISMSSFGPDVPEAPYHVRYMGFGIGGVRQPIGLADVAPLSVSYPAGFDPNATAGHAYNKDFPISPEISTLERPVRITGGVLPYAAAPPWDIWLVDTPDLFFTHPTLYQLGVHATLDGPAGDVAYAPFTDVPLSEIALFSDEPSVSPLIPYSPILTYFSFDPVWFTAARVLEVSWYIHFP